MQKIYQRMLTWKYAFILMLLVGISANASPADKAEMVTLAFQSQSISGNVTDDKGMSLPGVSVIEKGTSNGTVTDASGNFTMKVASQQSILVFTFVGSVTQQVVVSTQSDIKVQLMSDETTLDEIVVIGYGTQEQKDVTGSVTSLKRENFNAGVINTPEQLLQGKVAGVNVTSATGEPGAPQTITVRGPGGVRTGSTPLFVVDGMALDNSSTGGAINPLSFLNPHDIASIDVLKDASATAIYGTRGANGVILITTKRGKSGRASLSYSADFGVSKIAHSIDVFTADEFRQQVTAIGGTLDDQGASTDWQEEITRTAYTQNHNLNVSGGTEKASYYASLGIQDQEGILKNSNMKRYSGRLNITQKLLPEDRLSVDINLNAAQTISERPDISNIIGNAIAANPTYPVHDADGNLFLFPSGTGENPVFTLSSYKDITTTNRVIGNISPSLKIVKGLVYKMNFGVDNASSVRDIETFPSASPVKDGQLRTTIAQNTNTLIENYLTYNFTLNSVHAVDLLAGHSFQKFFIQSRTFGINKFPISDLDPRYNPGTGQSLNLTDNKPEGSATKNELQSFFGRVNYAMNDKYLVTATIRSDGSSKFGKNNKYGIFPSFSLGWRLSEEDFMKSLPISNLKLRAGWGKTGNQEIPAKITQYLFTATAAGDVAYPINGGAYPAGVTFKRFANPNIQWEVSTQFDAGLDFALLNGALTGTVDYFNKVSSNILLELVSYDPQSLSKYWNNVDGMEIVNKGVEFSLGYEYKTTNGLMLGVGGNTTFIKNQVQHSPYSVIFSGTISGSGLTSSAVNGYVNGEPIGTFFLKQFDGINENGVSKFVDRDDDGFITDLDRVAAGSALPKNIYSFYAKAAYKGFDLAINFNGVSGNKVYDNTANESFYRNRLFKGLNTTDAVLEYPTESNTNPASISTRYLKDGSFLRLNNASLGYNFNPTTLGLADWVSAIRLSVTGQNLFVATKYDSYDPEVNMDRAVEGVSSYGVDYRAYPKARTFLFGLNVTF